MGSFTSGTECTAKKMNIIPKSLKVTWDLYNKVMSQSDYGIKVCKFLSALNKVELVFSKYKNNFKVTKVMTSPSNDNNLEYILVQGGSATKIYLSYEAFNTFKYIDSALLSISNYRGVLSKMDDKDFYVSPKIKEFLGDLPILFLSSLIKLNNITSVSKKLVLGSLITANCNGLANEFEIYRITLDMFKRRDVTEVSFKNFFNSFYLAYLYYTFKNNSNAIPREVTKAYRYNKLVALFGRNVRL